MNESETFVQPCLLTIAVPPTEPRRDAPGERQLAGDPQFSIWNLERAADGTIASGIWETTPGRWRTVYDGKWEFCTIVHGALTITEDSGEPVTYRAGESFVIRDGFRGIWEARELTRKHYVVHMARR
ncbi:cupin domain-containing protein [Chelatococcus asaccharovorans]|uniref:cupin domain-containing protein n=1 Tax=Chelatococcus asaccharovorans TaxID=28210 RepID=UPI00224C6899|nr:cupin domain-containing protein [Chelatococcus asaccharovorans]CAH1653538.1 conserved hypothetical protein [Chelatococcus asaccharovorans]CAH1686013.1 conserved hypothetical protein [Chelatococcus asaccharovorans]